MYTCCRLFVATPSHWLMERVRRSMLAEAVCEGKVIHNGVDETCYRPAERPRVRRILQLPQDAAIFLFAANGVRRNGWKDPYTIQDAARRFSDRHPKKPALLILLGDRTPGVERHGAFEVRRIAYLRDPAMIARYYQAADVYVHAARAETFPNTVLEALACGTPVVATAVGGIPEQVRSLPWAGAAAEGAGAREPAVAPERATGILVPPGDAALFAKALRALMEDASLRTQLGENAAADVRARFTLKRQAREYLEWYTAIVNRWPQVRGAPPVQGLECEKT